MATNETFDSLELGQRIALRRKELNMTQDEVATRMGYKDRSSINKIELGKADLPQSKIKKIASVLQTSEAYIMGWTSNANEFIIKQRFTEQGNQSTQLTDEELSLLSAWKKASESDKLIISRVLNFYGMPLHEISESSSQQDTTSAVS